MCFECDTWFTDPGEWELHCFEHLQQPDMLLRCDPLMFRSAPIKAGFCPFCLGNKHLDLSKRMTQFVTNRSECILLVSWILTAKSFYFIILLTLIAGSWGKRHPRKGNMNHVRK
ncbi:hypothetical protein N7509_007343 [Penicillium cosmopolitanum]|uniref:Uncharacterized protein n=1 Tax=Penicillium cosmopolitanum TaxID=1131564 RepID=A0A9X0B8D3_9EURO|nr:uncharacterized protein N7509_007343 [Penicillium cosmopolitanum]KAJ5391853.1 hypothetical protein N7509_007343 [Penicillium cosmopolitanum]